jgi:hypothetical protein
MEDKLILAVRSKKSRNRYIASTTVFIIAAVVFYLITYVFKTVPEDRVFTYTIIVVLGLAAFVYYGFLLVRILLLPSELIVLREGELTVRGRVKLKAEQIKDVRTKYGFGSNPKFSYGRLVIIMKDNTSIIVWEVEDVAKARLRMHEVLGIE